MFTSLKYKHRRASFQESVTRHEHGRARPRTSRLGAGRKMVIDSAARSVLSQSLKGHVHIRFSHRALPSSPGYLIDAQEVRKLKKERKKRL